jgi:hypothetical protein
MYLSLGVHIIHKFGQPRSLAENDTQRPITGSPALHNHQGQEHSTMPGIASSLPRSLIVRVVLISPECGRRVDFAKWPGAEPKR